MVDLEANMEANMYTSSCLTAAGAARILRLHAWRGKHPDGFLCNRALPNLPLAEESRDAGGEDR